MNAAGLLIISLGLVLIVIGVKGSQHNIIASLKGVPARAGAAQNGPLSQQGQQTQRQVSPVTQATAPVFPTVNGQAPVPPFLTSP